MVLGAIMKAFHVEKPGSLEGLILRDDQNPIPDSTQVLVRIKATSLNFRELLILTGQYPAPALLQQKCYRTPSLPQLRCYR
jgi:NADPH:quinone reductase-like Zn-dependent oxidoreductase